MFEIMRRLLRSGFQIRSLARDKTSTWFNLATVEAEYATTQTLANEEIIQRPAFRSAFKLTFT